MKQKGKKELDPRDRIALSRRQAFKRMAAEAMVLFDEGRGQQHCALNEIGDLDRSKMEELIPAVDRSWQLDIEGNKLISVSHDGETRHELFELTEENRLTFNNINGRTSLNEISLMLTERMDWESEKSWEQVRSLFLYLVDLKVCTIANPHEE